MDFIHAGHRSRQPEWISSTPATGIGSLNGFHPRRRPESAASMDFIHAGHRSRQPQWISSTLATGVGSFNGFHRDCCVGAAAPRGRILSIAHTQRLAAEYSEAGQEIGRLRKGSAGWSFRTDAERRQYPMEQGRAHGREGESAAARCASGSRGDLTMLPSRKSCRRATSCTTERRPWATEPTKETRSPGAGCRRMMLRR